MTRTFDTAGVTQSEEAPAAPSTPTDVIARLEAEIAARDEIIKSLLARVAELERRLWVKKPHNGQAPVQRWAEEAAADDELARAVRTQARRPEGAPRHDAAADGAPRRHRRPPAEGLCALRRSDGDDGFGRPSGPPGVRP